MKRKIDCKDIWVKECNIEPYISARYYTNLVQNT